MVESLSNKEKSNTEIIFTYKGSIYASDRVRALSIVQEYATVSQKKSGEPMKKAAKELLQIVKSR